MELGKTLEKDIPHVNLDMVKKEAPTPIFVDSDALELSEINSVSDPASEKASVTRPASLVSSFIKEEQAATNDELRRVRGEYDHVKWKGRWTA